MGLALVTLERIGGAEPLGGEWEARSLMPLGMGDHGPEGSEGLAVAAGPEAGYLFRLTDRYYLGDEFRYPRSVAEPECPWLR